MQGATKAAVLLDPSHSHLGNGLQFNAAASLRQVLLGSGESLINENRLEDKHSKCSWIQRLKPRDEPELPKGSVAEVSFKTGDSERGDIPERMDMGSGNAHPVCFSSQDKAANGFRASVQAESNSAIKRQRFNDQKVNDGKANQRSGICQENSVIIEHGKSVASGSMVQPSNVGFGPWVNVSSGRKPETKPEVGMDSKIITGCVSTKEISEDTRGNFRSAFSSINSIPRSSPIKTAGVLAASSNFHKGSSSLVHSKPGLPPKPPGKRSPGFQPPSKVVCSPSVVAGSPSVVDRGMFNQFSESPFNREGDRAQGDHGKGPSDSLQHLFVASPQPMMGNHDPSVRQTNLNVAERASDYNGTGQPIDKCSDSAAAAAAQLENVRRGPHEDSHTQMSREGASTNLPVDGVDLHLTVSVPGMPVSKADSKKETRTESIKTSFQMLPSGNTRGALTSPKVGTGAAGAASLPWEMFVEPAASKIAREQFVKVYNRARDELKNQRMSQTVSRVSSMDGGLKLTLGRADATSERRSEREHEQQSELNILNSKLGSRTLSLEPCLKGKEQQSINHVERKGSVMTLENEQSGLRGFSLVLNTSWKQGEGFSREQTQPKLQRSVSAKMVGNGSEQVACQSLDERSAAHVKELRRVDKGHSSTVDAKNKELASTAIVGKRSRVTFEEHSISRIPQKAAASGVRQVSSPHVWLQRWHPNAVYNPKAVLEAQLPSDGKKDDTAGYLCLGVKKFRDGDGVAMFSGAKESKSFPADGENGMKSLKASPPKMLPSAAAMAIVGTAARQFCAAQPRRKGSFAFWSGYGEPSPRKVEPVQEKGKGFAIPDAYTTPNS